MVAVSEGKSMYLLGCLLEDYKREILNASDSHCCHRDPQLYRYICRSLLNPFSIMLWDRTQIFSLFFFSFCFVFFSVSFSVCLVIFSGNWTMNSICGNWPEDDEHRMANGWQRNNGLWPWDNGYWTESSQFGVNEPALIVRIGARKFGLENCHWLMVSYAA